MTIYSERQAGDAGNYDWTTRFDLTNGYLGITQWDETGETVQDRVLLSPTQLRALQVFLRQEVWSLTRRRAGRPSSAATHEADGTEHGGG